ncbi:MAG TPA: hypothetical protein VIH93_15920, partial [Thermoanaerobaculia bacterium]
DALSGDLSALSPIRGIEPGFSFSAFSSPADGEYVLALYGPRHGLRTIWARMRRAARLYKMRARIRRGRKR